MRLAMPCISTSFPHFFHNCHRPVTALSPHIPKQQMSTDLLQGKCGKTHPSGPHFMMQPFMAVKCSWKSQRISVTFDSPSQIVSRKLMAANVLHDAHQASADVFSVNLIEMSAARHRCANCRNVSFGHVWPCLAMFGPRAR